MATSSRRPQLPWAAFNYIMTADQILVIIDKGTPKSVTNGIENVIADIVQTEDLGSPASYRAVYADSDGDWAGVRLDEQGRFSSFYGLGWHVTDEHTALAGVRELHPTL